MFRALLAKFRKPASRRRHAGRSLKFESLEDRALMAANPIAHVPYVGDVHEGQPVIFLVSGYGGEAIPPDVRDWARSYTLENGFKPIVHVSHWNDILDDSANPTDDFDGTMVAANGSPGAIDFSKLLSGSINSFDS